MSAANSKLGAGRPSAGKSQKTLSDLADKAATVRVNFDLDRDEHTNLKVYAAKHGKTVKEVLTELVALKEQLLK